MSPKTLQPEQTRIGFNTFSNRLQISHDLRCSLEISDLGKEKSEYFSDEALVTATLERVSLARGIGREHEPVRPLKASNFNEF